MVGAAPDFQKFISDARERKRNEVLANAIFSRGRRQSAPSSLKPSPAASLASRVGVNKRVSSGSWNRNQAAGSSRNVDGDWTHDLHDSVSRHRSGSAVDARYGTPGSQRTAAVQRRSRLASAMDRMDGDQVNIVRSPASTGPGMSIRGLAGPFAVMGQNFAPGTTAADIESAVSPVGGEMVSCTIVKTSPFLLVEMVFASREGGERVIETFNDKTADGRVLKVYPKIGQVSYQAAPVSGSRASEQVVDGTLGFSGDRDLLESDSRSSSRSSRPLYSDRIVARGRGGRRYEGGR